MRLDLTRGVAYVSGSSSRREVQRRRGIPDVSDRTGAGWFEASRQEREHERRAEAENPDSRVEESLRGAAGPRGKRQSGESERGGEEEEGDRGRDHGERALDARHAGRAKSDRARNGEKEGEEKPVRGDDSAKPVEPSAPAFLRRRPRGEPDRVSGRTRVGLRVSDEMLAARAPHDEGRLPPVPESGERERGPDERQGHGGEERDLRRSPKEAGRGG